MDLLKAVKLESLEKIKELIKKQGISRDAKWTDYKILNVALEYNRKDVAAFLLEQNCRVNKHNKSVKISTPLHNAVNLGDVKIVEQLLEKQASVLAIDSEKNTPLHLAFINKNETLVDLLLDDIQKTSSYVNLQNNQGISHFHIACTAKDGQTIQAFLDAGANIDEEVNETSPYWAGFTAMHFAVNYKCLGAVSILLKLDAKHETKSKEGKTPLDIASQSVEDLLIIIDLLKIKSSNHQADDVFDLFKKKSSDLLKKKQPDDMKKDASESKLASMFNLYNETLSAASIDSVGNCLGNFHVACLTENDQVVEKYIKYGVDINFKSPLDLHLSCSSSSLHCAVISKCKKKVELLVRQGHKLNCQNSEDMTPLHLALYNEHLLEAGHESNEIVDLLYAAVEDKTLDQQDIYGMSYFHIAITRNDQAIVKKYLDKDRAFANKIISVNSHKFCKYSPLHLAVEYHHSDIVELLLNYGADINAVSQLGTPLHIAIGRGDIGLIDLLLKKGARVDLLDPSTDQTMLHTLLLHCYFKLPSRCGDELYNNSDAILLYIEHLVKLGVDVNAKESVGNTALHLTHLKSFDGVDYFQLLLDLGADVNIENIGGFVPLSLTDYNTAFNAHNYKKFLMYYHHVQKLKALGLKVHPKNEETCKLIVESGKFEEDELALMEQKRLDEIAKLKNIKLGDATTLCDFLKLDSKRAALFAQCKTLKKIAMDSELKEKYPLYGYLIRLQYNMAVKSYKNRSLQAKYDGPELR